MTRKWGIGLRAVRRALFFGISLSASAACGGLSESNRGGGEDGVRGDGEGDAGSGGAEGDGGEGDVGVDGASGSGGAVDLCSSEGVAGDGADPVPCVGSGYAPLPVTLAGDPLYLSEVPLTNEQWARSVQDVLRMDSPPSQAESLVAVLRGLTTFSNNERLYWMNEELIESRENAVAEIVAEQLADPNALSRIDAGTEASSFVRILGRRAFRRPLTEAEAEEFLLLFESGAGIAGDQTDFEKGASVFIQALFKHKNFSHRIESAAPGERLNGFEIIAKLSLWIVGTTPSDALLDRAAAGEFETLGDIVAVADELLSEPRASEMAVDLFAQLFQFPRFEDVLKEDPVYTPAMNPELLESSERFIQYIYEGGLGLRELLTSTQGYVGPLLAPLYEINPAPSEVTLVDLGSERAGFFSQVPSLMLWADGARADATERGLVLLQRVLCAQMTHPDDVVVHSYPAPDPAVTDRQLVVSRFGAGTCAEDCHAGYINPLGFAFENFDGLGRLREVDKDQPVDTSAAYPFESGGGSPVFFDGSPELMSAMLESREVHDCLARNISEYALQRDIASSDQNLIDELSDASMQEGGSLRELFLRLVQTPAFHSRALAN